MTFRAGLRAIGQTCLALCPWDDAAPLKSSWCHWQLLCALSADGKENGKGCHSPGKEGKEAGKDGKDDPKESAKEPPSLVAVGTTASEDERLREALVLDMEAPMKVLDTRADGWRECPSVSTDGAPPPLPCDATAASHAHTQARQARTFVRHSRPAPRMHPLHSVRAAGRVRWRLWPSSGDMTDQPSPSSSPSPLPSPSPSP